MSMGLRSRNALERRVEPKPPRDERIAGYFIGALTVLIIVGLVVDAFTRPAYWLGMP